MSDRVVPRLLTLALISSMSLGAVACTATGPAATSDQDARASQHPPAYSGDAPGHTSGAAGGGSPTRSSADPPSLASSPTDLLAPTSGPDQCTDGEGEPLVDSATWIERGSRPSLEVVPTDLLRDCGLRGPQGSAWRELLRIAPEAHTVGMQEQFNCHVLFAPGKAVWHLEPWRPVVAAPEMVASRCNPGGADPDLPCPETRP